MLSPTQVLQAPFDAAAVKAYDIRGTVPDQLNAESVTRLTWSLINTLSPKSCVIGWDVRPHSPMIVEAMTNALLDAGIDVTHLGLAGTEEVYHAVGAGEFELGAMITASHNPIEYNGIKLVGKGATPLIGDIGLPVVAKAAAQMTTSDVPAKAATPGSLNQVSDKTAYLDKLSEFVDLGKLKPLKIAINSGNGVSGPIVDALTRRLPFDIVHVHPQPDGDFPNGIPNPIIPEKRKDSIDAVLANDADFGVAFDGDFDRCFFFDETGRYIEGYYVVGLLAKALLQERPGASIAYDARLIWNSEQVIAKAGGKPVISKSGHTFLKACLREHGAIYGGEMSAHHYFADFYNCDSGMVPWLLVAQLVSTSGQSLSQLVDEMIEAFPCPGETNFKLADANAQQQAIAAIRETYAGSASDIAEIDGLSLSFGDAVTPGSWRMNVRSSNTEPLLRLNIETVGDKALADAKLSEIGAIIERFQ